jgi:hypothetical protein
LPPRFSRLLTPARTSADDNPLSSLAWSRIWPTTSRRPSGLHPHSTITGRPVGVMSRLSIDPARAADPRRQALEPDLLRRYVQPGVQVRIVRDQLFHLGVGPRDVLRSPDRATHRNGPIPGQNSGRI